MLEIWFWMFMVAGEPQTGPASQFAHVGDKWQGGPSPCLKENGRLRRVVPDDHIIAHRTLPCGTEVVIRNKRTLMTTTALVGERGPYGACIAKDWKRGRKCPKGKWVLKRRVDDPGGWRGIADLTPSVAQAIGHNGFEQVDIFVVKKTSDDTKLSSLLY